MRAMAAVRTADPFQWLNHLKNDQLRQVGRTIGSNSTGKKTLLLQRLKRDLRRPEYRAANLVHPTDLSNANPREMRVLSIDMGIRNLAYAHFVVPPDTRTRIRDPMIQSPVPCLTDWRRLSVEQILSLDDKSEDPLSESQSPSETEDRIEGMVGVDELEIEKSSITSDTYARHAYNFISTLVAKHNPTHVLIERQRLRSSGSPNVFQSVLGVAMFESQIHAALYAMQRERGLEVHTHAVDPAMVVASLGGLLADQPRHDYPGEKKPVNMAEDKPKRARVDLVGRWLSTWARDAGVVGEVLDDIDATIAHLDGLPNIPVQPPASGARRGELRFRSKIRIGDDSRMRQFALAYLQEWQQSVTRRRPRHTHPRTTRERNTRSSTRVRSDFRLHKLDDLADCLVQGLVWLNWHIMRDKVAREGLRALDWDDAPEKKRKMKK